MEYLTHQGLRLSRLGVGCYSLSGAYGKKDAAEFREMIDYARQAGVNFFDTADAYGNAEEILGQIIKPYRSDILISTKVGVREGIKADLSPDYIKTACENSLKRLQTDYIDIYNLHYNDPDTPAAETIGALEELVQAGKIRRFGLGHLPEEKVVEYLKKGQVFSIMMELSAVSSASSRGLLALCREYDTAGIAFSITGRGLLTGKYDNNSEFEKGDIRNYDPQFQRERLEFALQVRDKLREIGGRHGKTSVQTAIAWVLAQKGIISALTGPSSVKNLRENLGGIAWELSGAELNEIEDFIKEKEIRLGKQQRETVRNIIENELPGEMEQAFIDLLYCIETAIINGYVQEEKVMPIFYRLFTLKNRLAKLDYAEMEDIQREVREIINLP